MSRHVEAPDFDQLAIDREIANEFRQDRDEIKRLRAALERITKLECERFVFPSDWHEQIEACSECQRYKSHPIQQGICDEHRKPLYARERHDDHQQRTLIYKAQDIARDALTHEQTPKPKLCPGGLPCDTEQGCPYDRPACREAIERGHWSVKP